MNEQALTAELAALLAERHFYEPFPYSCVADLLEVLRHVRLAAGETLMRQGEHGDEMYVVLAGRVSVQVEHEDGTRTVVDEIASGSVVGEMALLTGLPRTATVTAIQPTDLARLTRDDFERLAAKHPHALNEFLRRILPRLRRTQLVRVLTELFGELAEPARADLERHLQWVQLDGGGLLFREGDVSDDVYVVINGRLRAVTSDADGRERVLEEVGRGTAVGEVSLLTGEPRSATVYAVRDSDLLRLSKRAFDELTDLHPRAMMQIARSAAWRLRRMRQPTERKSSGPTAFALIAATPGVPLAAFARRLVDQLSTEGTTLKLGSADVDRLLAKPGIAQSGEDTIVHESIVAWLSGQERDHGFLVLEGDREFSAWTRRCLRQADRVLIVADARDDPAPQAMELAVAQMGLKARCELVLLQGDGIDRPSGTGIWLDARQVATHHHVRLAHDGDLRRIARRVSGRAVGLVLGGGGARGFAHIGTLRALQECGVEVDMVGGTSIGAMIAAAHASGLSTHVMMELARTFASPRKLLDRTLPVVSLMAGRKVTALYQRIFGDVAIEDLWVPCFAVSSGLSRSAVVVHRKGTLWMAVRASTAIPAIFPPMLSRDHEVLVDGNVMNNMPLDVMREWCESGTVIGVNPMPTHDKLKPYEFGPSLTGWAALMGRLRWFGSKIRAPSILGVVMRATEINSANRMRQPLFRALADVLIEPAVEKYGILEFDAYEPIIEIGYRSAQEKVEAWRATTSRRMQHSDEVAASGTSSQAAAPTG
jgi:predicted acylesterase/phospholipase RssA/CRP-like cAMP-binding protein